jgi:putative salt-induced outer membrane protein YdiY
METDYSDSDFKIEWDGVARIYTQTLFIINTSDGKKYNGSIQSASDENIQLNTFEYGVITTNKNNLVYLKNFDQGFWSRLSVSIDLGFSLTRAQDLRQYSMRANAGYLTKSWQLLANYNWVRSTQAETDDIKRTDASVSFRYFLAKSWNAFSELNTLSNTEQQLDLRSTLTVGIGKFIFHTNRTYWNFGVGITGNNEFYFESQDDRRSLEGLIGTELNLFDIGDLSLLSSLSVFPSITETGRLRTDFKFDLKYDLPKDFYIKTGLTLNYDNQPVEGTPESDYVFQTSFGWEL